MQSGAHGPQEIRVLAAQLRGEGGVQGVLEVRSPGLWMLKVQIHAVLAGRLQLGEDVGDGGVDRRGRGEGVPVAAPEDVPTPGVLSV